MEKLFGPFPTATKQAPLMTCNAMPNILANIIIPCSPLFFG
jgi:hypothetical protein